MIICFLVVVFTKKLIINTIANKITKIIKKIFIQPPDLVVGFSALMSVIVFMCGMLMLMLGLVGEYLGRIYVSMNNSPQYVIREVVGKTDDGAQK